jgi:hypothetical protein
MSLLWRIAADIFAATIFLKPLSGRAILSLPEHSRVLVASYIGTQKFVVPQ